MKGLSSKEAQDLCMKLLHAEIEDEVIAILKEYGFWDDRAAWKPYGEINNNRGIVGNQQSSPVAALVEKIINSIDAVLTAECYRNDIDPTSDDAPQGMNEAVDFFFNVHGGRLENLTASRRTELAEKILLVACGTKENPSYLIVDEGEGQCPEDFPKTFLSLLRDNKTKIPFVQGKYNMGGTGVLQFSGFHSFQLLISKRQPDIPPKDNKKITRNKWGFTLVRRIDPAADQPQSTYVYLAPNNEILSFDNDDLLLRPGKWPEKYVVPLKAGTCIKIWNYKFPGRLKTLATIDLRYALEKYMLIPALPIRICERRQYKANSYDTTMSGLATVLIDNKNDIEPGLDTGGPIDISGVGQIIIRLVVLKDTLDVKKYPSGLFFHVNGQLHSEEGSEFIARRTKLDYIAKSLIVMIDCTDLPTRIREDLFLASRDRMRQCPERSALIDAIAEFIQDHPGLKELNARRRQERLASALTDKEPADVIQKIVRNDPTLATLFGVGKRIKVPEGPTTQEEPFVGQQYPTYFRIIKEPKNGLVKQCPKNKTCRIELETDAANDYFSRPANPGHFEVKGSVQQSSIHLWNGKAIVRFAPPTTGSDGDRLNVEMIVNDLSRTEPFKNKFTMIVLPEAPPTPSGPGGTPKPPGSWLKAMPNIKEVHSDEWAKYDFNEYSSLIIKTGDEETLDIFINMDNLYLRNEIARRRNIDPDILKYWFKYGLCLQALGMLYQFRHELEQECSSEEDAVSSDKYSSRFDEISISCKGLAMTIIPVIAQLSKGKELAKSTEDEKEDR